jgi:hypothetical protein
VHRLYEPTEEEVAFAVAPFVRIIQLTPTGLPRIRIRDGEKEVL